MSSAVCLSVCRLSVTFVCPTQAIEIFGNIFTLFGMLAICWLPGKILRRLSQGNPSVGGVNTRGVGEYIAILDLLNAISQKRCKIGAKLVTNRKSRMSFRLVPNSVTLDDPEWHNSPNRRVISLNSVAFGADYVKVAEDTSILRAAKM